jgi:hypothetical protein
MSVGFPADGSRSSRMFGSGPQAAWRPRNARGAWRSGPAAVTRAPAWLVRRRALSFDQRSTVSEKHGVENTGPADLFVVDFRREFSTLLSIECGLAGRASTNDRFSSTRARPPSSSTRPRPRLRRILCSHARRLLQRTPNGACAVETVRCTNRRSRPKPPPRRRQPPQTGAPQAVPRRGRFP